MSPDPVVSSPPVLVRLEIPAEHRYLNVVGACAIALLDRVPNLEEAKIVSYNIELALHEACANIVDHAYAGWSGRIVIEFHYTAAPQQLAIDLYDTGAAFDPSAVPPPNLDDAQIHGYGLFLVRSLMDEVRYEALPDGNHWRLVKQLV
jgi:serine/threonine-protein kinase RsbW